MVDVANKPVVWATGEIVSCECFFCFFSEAVMHPLLNIFKDPTRISSQLIPNANEMWDDEEDQVEADLSAGMHGTSATGD